jgi:hypothetical protein
MSEEGDIINCLGGAGDTPVEGAPALPKFGQVSTGVLSVDSGETEPPAADPVVSAGVRAQGLLRGFCLVLRHHNAPHGVIDSMRNQVLAYLSMDESGGPLTESAYVKRAKYTTCAPMSWYLKTGCEPLKKPPVAWIPTGQFRNWFRVRLRSRSTRNTHLFYSWLQAKRAALPLTEEMVHTAYEEHRVAMDQLDPIDDETHDGVMEVLEPILADVCEQLLSTYQPSTLEEHLEHYGDLEGDTRHVASTRACFEKSRDKGGQLGALMERAFTKKVVYRNPEDPTETWESYELDNRRAVFDLELVRISYHTQCVVGGVVVNNACFEHYRKPIAQRAWTDAVLGEAFFYHGQALKATIQVVLEPLKTRVISKGEATPYYLSKPLQIKIHDILRHRGEFRLIGRPLSATDLMDLEENRVGGGVGSHEWFSIDYSAATDGLSARLSASIMGRILRGQTSDLLPIWMSVLAPHLCRYPFPHDDVLPIQQRNGQLMGSILSFPILCLANLGLYLYTIKDDPRPLKQKLRGVLVNGDDMLYVARRSRWAAHVANGEKVGLKMSPGKAYHDRVFANANSACFHFPLLDENRSGTFVPEHWASPPRKVAGIQWEDTFIPTRFVEKRYSPKAIPFLNSGLYFGQNKVMNKVSETGSEVQSRAAVIEELLKGCRPGLPSRVREIYAGYLKRHKSDLFAECGHRNLFISRGLGGMGLTPHRDLKFKITTQQRQAAYELYHQTRFGHLGYGPLPGPEIPEAPIQLRTPWQPVLAGVDEGKGLWKRSKPASGTPMLSKYQCLQPFRLCNVPRKRARTDFPCRAREGFQRSLMDKQREERRADEIEHLTFDEAGPYGPLVDEYHSWLDEGVRVCYADFDVLRPWLGSEEWEPFTPEVLDDLAQPSWAAKETILLEARRQDMEEGC